jgi:hypothetical protein
MINHGFIVRVVDVKIGIGNNCETFHGDHGGRKR